MPTETDLDVIRADPAIPDETASSEITELEVDHEKDRRQILNEGLKQDLELRKSFAWDIFYLIIGWLLLVFAVLFLQGFSVAICTHTFRLSDAIILALIGGTTINVLGIFIIVVRYLFPQSVTSVS